MWQVVGTRVDVALFEPFEPLHVMNSYDGPRIFTLRVAQGALYLACWSDDDEWLSRFLVVPISLTSVAELEAGLLSVRDALRQSHLWVVDLSHDGPVVAAWLVDPDSVPEDAQPERGAMLHRPLTPPRIAVIDGNVTDPTHHSVTKRL